MALFIRSVLIEAPVGVLFAFHERPDALKLLTPRFPPVRVVSQTGGIAVGSRVELRVAGLTWIALHTAYEKNRLFIDEQIEGPFAKWVHRHEFEDLGERSKLTDKIAFRLPAGLPGWLATPSLAQMFRHRHRVTKKYCEDLNLRPLPGI